MTSVRKTEISIQLFRALQKLNEADIAANGSVPPQPQQTPQAVANSNPVQPLPGQAQQDSGSFNSDPVSSNGEPLSIDSMINKMNIIRGGRSFNEPEIYGQLSALYNTLRDQDKLTIDRVLDSIGKIVVQQNNSQMAITGQTQGTTSAQPPPAGIGKGAIQQPGASQAMAMAAPSGTVGPTAAMA